MSIHRERMMRNFIGKYGMARFRMLIELLGKGTNNRVIGDMFGVSRERVRQWKNAFGTEVRVYQVHPDVQTALTRWRS